MNLLGIKPFGGIPDSLHKGQMRFDSRSFRMPEIVFKVTDDLAATGDNLI